MGISLPKNQKGLKTQPFSINFILFLIMNISKNNQVVNRAVEIYIGWYQDGLITLNQLSDKIQEMVDEGLLDWPDFWEICKKEEESIMEFYPVISQKGVYFNE